MGTERLTKEQDDMGVRLYLDWTLVLCSRSQQRNLQTAFFCRADWI